MTNASNAHEPVFFINVITPHPGKLDEFIAIQQTTLPALARQISGLRSSQLHKSLDGDKAVMVVAFDSIADHQNWLRAPAFAEHQKKIAPLIAHSERGYFARAYEAKLD